MPQVLIRNLSEQAIETFRLRAKLKGTSLEQELRAAIESGAALTPNERVEICQKIRAMTPGPIRPLTTDERREGLA